MNIVGFGGLMIASHRGLHSLGRVLTLGMACCLVSCLVMPAFLRMLPNLKPAPRRTEPEPEEPPPARDVDLGLDLASPVVESHVRQSVMIRRREATGVRGEG